MQRDAVIVDTPAAAATSSSRTTESLARAGIDTFSFMVLVGSGQRYPHTWPIGSRQVVTLSNSSWRKELARTARIALSRRGLDGTPTRTGTFLVQLERQGWL